MNLKAYKSFYLLILILALGCSPIQDRALRFVGRSIDHLEKRRDRATSQHVTCSVSDCFDAILIMGNNRDGKPVLGKRFEVFQASRRKGVIVFYYIPKQIDTTEAAVFISPDSNGSLIQVVSLSSAAQEKVAEAVFEEMKANHFQ